MVNRNGAVERAKRFFNDAFSHVIGLPTIWVLHSYGGCSQHAPNEHFLGAIGREGLQLMTGLFWDVGETKANFVKGEEKNGIDGCVLQGQF